MNKYKQFQLISVHHNKLGNGQLFEMQEYFIKSEVHLLYVQTAYKQKKWLVLPYSQLLHPTVY